MKAPSGNERDPRTPGRGGPAASVDGLPADNEDFAWLAQVLGRRASDGVTRYLCRPSIDHPQFLVPTRPRRAAASSLRRFHDARSPKERAAGLAGQLLARAGLLQFAPGEPLDLPEFGLVDHLAHVLGEAHLYAAITLGPRRRNRKPVLQLIRPDGDVVGFAKIGWTPFTTELVSNEARWLAAVEQGTPAWLRTPPVLHRTTWRDLEVLVIGTVDTPFSSRSRHVVRTDVVDAVAHAIGTDHRRFGESALVDHWRASGLDRRIDLERLVERRGEETLEFGLWHGDLTPWNIATQGGSISVWDWEFAAADRPIGFDVLHAHFEDGRRRRGESDDVALRHLATRAMPQLHELGQAQRFEPMFDLYLAELLAREQRLIGQGWTSAAQARIDEVAGALLEERLAR